jgi:hypothetical protein
MNTNNPLAVEPETENDAGCEKFFLISAFRMFSFAAAAAATRTRIS